MYVICIVHLFLVLNVSFCFIVINLVCFALFWFVILKFVLFFVVNLVVCFASVWVLMCHCCL